MSTLLTTITSTLQQVISGDNKKNDRNWAALGLLSVGGAALAALSLLHCSSPFPRGRISRSTSSLPFSSSAVCPIPSCAHQFFRPEQFRFANLSQGRVRYIMQQHPKGQAKNDGRFVVMIHGFSIACDIWKQQFDYLFSKGFNVLTLDNYGRGWSDALDITLDDTVYVGQIAELLFSLSIPCPIDLLGVSMGGAIVTTFTATYPEKVARLGQVCPAGLPIIKPSAFSESMSWPFVGPYLFLHFIARMGRGNAVAQWEQDVTGDEFKAWSCFAGQNVVENKGFLRTLFKTVTQYPMYDQKHNYARIVSASPSMPKLILWGELDGLTPHENAEKLAQLLPGAQVVTVVGAKHNFLIERPQPINETLEEWLNDLSGTKKLPARIRNSIKQIE